MQSASENFQMLAAGVEMLQAETLLASVYETLNWESVHMDH